MEGQDVVTSDDHKIGTVVAEHDGCVIVETGHIFKSRHAVPTDFIHEHDGVLRATVAKEIVDDSPKVDGDSFDANAVKMHYGLIEVHVVDPDPQDANAETDSPGVDDRVEPRTLGLGDTATFGGHPRSYVSENDRSPKPGERDV
jgi:hypothetical protein